MRMLRGAMSAALLALMLVGVAAPSAEAHERRQVGPYVFVVGFQNEPAYVEEPNGASLTVFRTDGQPVEGVDKTLKVEISTGGASRTFNLKPVFNRPGAYVAEFIPTKTGGYTFRFFGTIEGQEINERFESGPNRFDEVQGKADLEFPASVPTNGELAAQIRAGRAAETQWGATPTSEQLKQALDRADNARTTGIVVGTIGIAAGLAGVALALVALHAQRRGSAAGGGETEPA